MGLVGTQAMEAAVLKAAVATDSLSCYFSEVEGLLGTASLDLGLSSEISTPG